MKVKYDTQFRWIEGGPHPIINYVVYFQQDEIDIRSSLNGYEHQNVESKYPEGIVIMDTLMPC